MPRCALSCSLSLLVQLMTLTNLCDGVCKNMHSLPVFGGEGLGDYCEKTLHNFNCSVGPRKDIEGDTTLECKIRRQKGWEEYMETILNPSHCPLCEPSQLTSLRVVRISKRDYLDEEYSYPAIQLSFTVPKPSVNRSFYPGGISLTFSSDSQPMTGDYEFETRYRLLDFPKYGYSSPDLDKRHQRTLIFPCLIGFQHEPCQSEEYKVYSVSIKSFSRKKTNLQETAFSELTYNITVYNFYVYHPYLWKSTIAVAFFPREKDVSFVFDPVPDAVTFQMYTITLIDAHSNIPYRTQRIFKDQLTQNVFLGVEDGIYYILIEVITSDFNCPKNCRYTRSHSFTVGNFQPLQHRVRREGEYPTEEIKIAAILIGTGIVLLVILIGIFRYHRRKKRFDLPPPELLNGHLIYSNDSSESSTLARELAKFCMKKMQIHISTLKPQNDIVQKDYTTCFKRELEKSKIVIIFWTPESISRQQECHNTFSYFETSVNLALNLEHQKNIKLACVYFIKSHKTSIPNDLPGAAHIFLFPEEFPQFCSYIQGLKSRRNHELTKALKHAIYDLKRNNRVEYQHNQTVSKRLICNDKMDDDDVVDDSDDEVSLTSKSLLEENHPLIGTDKTSFSDLPHVERKASTIVKKTSLKEQCKSPVSKEVLAMVHIHVPSCASDRTSQIIGSDLINEHDEQSLGSNSSKSLSSSLISISRLPLKTIPPTLEDSNLHSQSSGCEPITILPSSSTKEYEPLNSSFTSTPHHYQHILPNSGTDHIDIQYLNSEEAYLNARVENGKMIQDVGVLSHCMKCQKVRSKEDKTSECFGDNSDSYSVHSESITSSQIDLCDFT